jgi:hypothetical protein
VLLDSDFVHAHERANPSFSARTTAEVHRRRAGETTLQWEANKVRLTDAAVPRTWTPYPIGKRYGCQEHALLPDDRWAMNGSMRNEDAHL